MSGSFCISLDYELSWGIIEKDNLESYKITNVANAKDVANRLLNTFEEHNIRATWAIVGIMLTEGKTNLVKHMKINYLNGNMCPYSHVIDNPDYYYENEVINRIIEIESQELASHTFSHFYVNEQGQEIKDFKNDLELFKLITQPYINTVTSIVFPRNQISNNYILECSNFNYLAFRGVLEKVQFKNRYFGKVINFLDSFINVLGFSSYKLNYNSDRVHGMLNIKASRFLRPCFGNYLLRRLHLKRIKSEMTYAAKNNEVYHLWWHPHNFGNHSENAFYFLSEIIKHYKLLENKYGFQSRNMNDFVVEGLES